MIKTSSLKIPVTEKLSTQYIENFFSQKDLKVLRWAITGCDKENYFLDVSIIE